MSDKIKIMVDRNIFDKLLCLSNDEIKIIEESLKN